MRIRAIIVTIAAAIAMCCTSMRGETSQAIVDSNFRTLKVEVDGYPMAPPVISLKNPSDRIVISFDELADERRYMRYELMHCDSQWRPDGLIDSEFLDGFNQADVENYAFSRATTVHYVNYRITIPDQSMRPTLSGNYMVRVYPEDNPDETILRARFSVSDGSIDINGRVTTRTDIDTNDSHQQLEIEIDDHDATVDDLYGDLRVTVTQNGRPDNEVTVTTPMRVSGRKAIFEHLRPLIFDAGNEYRRMETVSTSYPGMHVDHIGWIDPMYHFFLSADAPRKDQPYTYDRTQHGRFVIREYNSSDSDTEADYGIVHFTLTMDKLEGYDIFIDGDFTNRQFCPESRMVYNNATHSYEAAIALKQGAYNYQYLCVPVGGPEPERGGVTAPVEGNKYETVNEYVVKVYHRPRGSRYDRLAGATVIYSDK